MTFGDVYRQLSSFGHAATGRRVVKSAMTPLVTLTLIVTPTCIAGAYAFREKDALCLLLVIAGLLPPFVALLAYVFFALRDPDRLHSEDYRIKARVLQITEAKGGRLAINPVDLADIANPYPEVAAIEQKQQASPRTLNQGGKDG